jgi:Flp pilus assembly protein TadG
MQLRRKCGKRTGATAVEFAIVSVLVFGVIFGIFEYARLIFMRELAENATRDGARLAIVSTGVVPSDPTAAAVKALVTSRMAGLQNQITGYTVNVYASDATGNPIPGENWYDAAFAQGIGVQITGTYKPVVTGFIGLSTTININFRTVMSSEAN